MQRITLAEKLSFVGKPNNAISLAASVQLHIGLHFVLVLDEVVGVIESGFGETRVFMVDLARRLQFLLQDPILFVDEMRSKVPHEGVLLLRLQHNREEVVRTLPLPHLPIFHLYLRFYSKDYTHLLYAAFA